MRAIPGSANTAENQTTLSVYYRVTQVQQDYSLQAYTTTDALAKEFVLKTQFSTNVFHCEAYFAHQQSTMLESVQH